MVFDADGRKTHHRRASSISSLKSSTKPNPEKVQKYQAFERWKQERAYPSPAFMITGLKTLAHRADWLDPTTFVVECLSPDGHWFIRKNRKDIFSFERDLNSVFPVEAGKKGGKPRTLPSLPAVQLLPEILFRSASIYGWWVRAVNDFLAKVFGASLLVSKSKLVEDFLKTDAIEEIVEQPPLQTIKVSAPWTDGPKLYCEYKEVEVRTAPLLPWIQVVREDGSVWPVLIEPELTLAWVKSQLGASALTSEARQIENDEELKQFVTEYAKGANAGILQIK